MDVPDDLRFGVGAFARVTAAGAPGHQQNACDAHRPEFEWVRLS
jgi:hypothetical protein